MSVFKKFQGKRIRPDDPNWERGRWYVWKRVAGVVIHRGLKEVKTENEALEVEAQLIRTIARKANLRVANKVAAKVVTALNGMAEKPPEPDYLYILESGGYYKIGRSTRIAHRMRQIAKTIIPFETKLIMAVEIEDGAVECERYFHNRYADYLIRGEWYDLTLTQLAGLKREVVEYSSIP